MKFNFTSFCLPSKIYLALAVFSIVFSLIISTETVFAAFIHLIFALFWTWILNLICKSGFSIVSWVLVLFPIAVYIILITYVLYLTRKTIQSGDSGAVDSISKNIVITKTM